MIKCFSFIHFRKKIIDTKQKRKKNTLMYIHTYIYIKVGRQTQIFLIG